MQVTPGKGMKCVVVASATVTPPSASSAASLASSVDLPPLPMTDVTPGRISSASCKFIRKPNKK